jgi:hypothetical protein
MSLPPPDDQPPPTFPGFKMERGAPEHVEAPATPMAEPPPGVSRGVSPIVIAIGVAIVVIVVLLLLL